MQPTQIMPVPVANGITRAELEQLQLNQRVLVAEWTAANSGGARGEFVPAAIRRMPLQTRLAFAQSDELTLAWQQRERRRVVQGWTRESDGYVFTGPHYFTEQYGSIEPPIGSPEPFYLWPVQVDALGVLTTEQRTVVAKARRLGLSWLALHYATHLLEFEPSTPSARVLILSKRDTDAADLLKRVKRIDERLPEWLRCERPHDGEDSVTQFALRDGLIKSFPATENVARQETATFVILDEFAFVKNGGAADIWTAIQPTIEGGGRICVISTGNGKVGNGATFAQIVSDAAAGRSTAKLVFLPWHARPDRTPQWLEDERSNYTSEDEFRAEYPATIDEALAGGGSVSVYPHDGIAAAERLGAALWDSPLRPALLAPPPDEQGTPQGVEWGTDWGDFQTFTVYGVPLMGGGVFIIDELLQPHIEPGKASRAIIEHDPAAARAEDGGKLPVVRSAGDASPAGTNATFVAALDAAWQDPMLRGRIPEQHVRVPFGVFKDGGGDRREGYSTVDFLWHLFDNSAAWAARGDTIATAHACIAIHPRCSVLLEQLRNLERDPETAKVRKPSLDPRHPECGDHGPDSLIALCADRAVRWTTQLRAQRSDEG